MSRTGVTVVTLLLLAAAASASGPSVSRPSMPVATYSVVGFDPDSGELGVAVQSHWFSVGPIVPWAEAGVGAVATQSLVDPAYGPLGLQMMRAGRSAPDALAGLLASDENRDIRQVAMIDASGRVAAHTGTRCIAAAGHVVGENFSVQANIMVDDSVWPAMAEAWRAAEGVDLAERLLRVLEAAESRGGDQRGRQSAALLVVRGEASGRPWVDRRFDLRVEDHPDPVTELRRLVRLARAYDHMNRGDELVAEEKWDEAMMAYAAATEIAPDLTELPFWQAVTLWQAGHHDQAVPIFEDVFRRRGEWRELLRRLPDAGLLDADAAEAILSIGQVEVTNP